MKYILFLFISIFCIQQFSSAEFESVEDEFRFEIGDDWMMLEKEKTKKENAIMGLMNVKLERFDIAFAKYHENDHRLFYSGFEHDQGEDYSDALTKPKKYASRIANAMNRSDTIKVISKKYDVRETGNHDWAVFNIIIETVNLDKLIDGTKTHYSIFMTSKYNRTFTFYFFGAPENWPFFEEEAEQIVASFQDEYKPPFIITESFNTMAIAGGAVAFLLVLTLVLIRMFRRRSAYSYS